MNCLLKKLGNITAERHLRLAAISSLVLLFFSFSASSEERTQLDSAPTGELINVGTHHMHLFCAGSGGPTVILNAGLGGLSLEWLEIQARLARYVKTCAYDRSGYGWSETSPYPGTSSFIVDELFTMLHNAKVPGPYIMVGHSFGGYVSQLFASRYPRLTRGVVLIDSSHPEQVDRFRSVGLNTAPTRPVTHVRFSKPRLHRNLPAAVRTTTMSLLLNSATMAAVAEEYVNFRLSAEQVAEELRLPRVPLIVVTRGQQGWQNDPRGKIFEGLWLELQDELARLSVTASHLIADNSGHHIHLDQPGVVNDAITMIVLRARKESPRAFSMDTGGYDAARENWLKFRHVTWHIDRLRANLHAWPLQPERRIAAPHTPALRPPGRTLVMASQIQ